MLDLLHVVAGVSYYKAGAPPRIVAPAPLGPAEAVALFTAVYTHGLAEYAYRNDLPHVLDLRPRCRRRARRPPPVDNADGGGRCRRSAAARTRSSRWRSCAAAGLDPVPFSVNPNPVIVSVNAASGLPALAARRKLDPRLFDAEQGRRAERAHPGHRDQLADRHRHRGPGTGSARW